MRVKRDNAGLTNISRKIFAECCAMLLFRHILNMLVQRRLLTSMKNEKNKKYIYIKKKKIQNKCIHFCLSLD